MDPVEIYRDLKRKIIWLELTPGSILNQVEIAQVYGVSRNPVTIALTRLDAEEWAVRQGSHFVSEPSDTEPDEEHNRNTIRPREPS